MSVASKFRTMGWFVRRPSLWGQMAVVAGRRLQPSLETPAHRARATEWCDAHAVDTVTALRALGWQQPVIPFEEVTDAREWAAARSRAEQSPVKMGGAGNLDLLYYCAELTQARRVLETGVAYGWSSYTFLKSLANRPGAKLASTDMPYAQLNNDRWVGTVVPESLRPMWTLVRQADRQGLSKALHALGGTLDLCHYDSDKSYQGRMWAYPILWEALAPGGLFISDDIQDNEGFRHFVEKLGCKFQIVAFAGKHIGLIKKGS